MSRRFKRYLFRILMVLLGLAGLLFTLALVMILWSDPTFARAPDVSPEALAAAGISFEQPYKVEVRRFRMRDGTMLASQELAKPGSRTTIVFVHGVLASSFQHNRDSGLLREATGANVIAVDLRGHGASGGPRGDVDYIGQYEDDLADVIREIRAHRPDGKIILAGHSMGGGIALRYSQSYSQSYAQRPGVPPVDGYLLFAPYLGWTSPTTRKEADPNASGGAELLKIHLSRILGLKLLNAAGITAFNGLRTELFNLPPEVPLRSYSYRAMENGAPEDYREALRAVHAPLLVIVGSRDEAFLADHYVAVVQRYSRGKVVIVPDASHNGVLHDGKALAAVTSWLPL
jgi:pimeloyl-ACP methyl ester carboxylesterase